MTLGVLAYNLARIVNLVGIKQLIAAVGASRRHADVSGS